MIHHKITKDIIKKDTNETDIENEDDMNHIIQDINIDHLNEIDHVVLIPMIDGDLMIIVLVLDQYPMKVDIVINTDRDTKHFLI